MDRARMTSYRGGPTGRWRVTSQTTVVGPVRLAQAARVEVVQGDAAPYPDDSWVLRGVTSNLRYVERDEQDALSARQEEPGRPSSTLAALIPVRKSAAWWALTQDERRAVLEERSAHIATGLEYLPAIARRLHHARDLGEPFDFLTWFEFAPADAPAFDELLGRMRQSEEWRYVDAEVDLRLERTPGG